MMMWDMWVMACAYALLVGICTYGLHHAVVLYERNWRRKGELRRLGHRGRKWLGHRVRGERRVIRVRSRSTSPILPEADADDSQHGYTRNDATDGQDIVLRLVASLALAASKFAAVTFSGALL